MSEPMLLSYTQRIVADEFANSCKTFLCGPTGIGKTIVALHAILRALLCTDDVTTTVERSVLIVIVVPNPNLVRNHTDILAQLPFIDFVMTERNCRELLTTTACVNAVVLTERSYKARLNDLAVMTNDDDRDEPAFLHYGMVVDEAHTLVHQPDWRLPNAKFQLWGITPYLMDDAYMLQLSPWEAERLRICFRVNHVSSRAVLEADQRATAAAALVESTFFVSKERVDAIRTELRFTPPPLESRHKAFLHSSDVTSLYRSCMDRVVAHVLVDAGHFMDVSNEIADAFKTAYGDPRKVIMQMAWRCSAAIVRQVVTSSTQGLITYFSGAADGLVERRGPRARVITSSSEDLLRELFAIHGHVTDVGINPIFEFGVVGTLRRGSSIVDALQRVRSCIQNDDRAHTVTLLVPISHIKEGLNTINCLFSEMVLVTDSAPNHALTQLRGRFQRPVPMEYGKYVLHHMDVPHLTILVIGSLQYFRAFANRRRNHRKRQRPTDRKASDETVEKVAELIPVDVGHIIDTEGVATIIGRMRRPTSYSLEDLSQCVPYRSAFVPNSPFTLVVQDTSLAERADEDTADNAAVVPCPTDVNPMRDAPRQDDQSSTLPHFEDPLLNAPRDIGPSPDVPRVVDSSPDVPRLTVVPSPDLPPVDDPSPDSPPVDDPSPDLPHVDNLSLGVFD